MNKLLIAIKRLWITLPFIGFWLCTIDVADARGGGSSGGGVSGGFGIRHYGGEQFTRITEKTFLSLIVVVLLVVAALLPFAFLREIYNIVRFKDKEFTEDTTLIAFTQTVHPAFSNQYSVHYFTTRQRWQLVELKPELDESQYQHLVSRSELIEKLSYLFDRYQQDWMRKNFETMKEYVKEPFYTAQYKLFQREYGEGIDVIYSPKILNAAPLSYRQELDKYIFRMQLNAKMVNFALSPKGYVLSGEDFPRSFTEYWDIAIDTAQQWYLIDINSV